MCLYSPDTNVILVYFGELKACRLKYTANQANGVIISSRRYKIPFKPVVYYKHVATSPSHFLTVLFSKHCFRQTWSGCVQRVCGSKLRGFVLQHLFSNIPRASPDVSRDERISIEELDQTR